MDVINTALSSVSDFLYSYILIIILIGAGLYFFITTAALPLRHLPESIRVVGEKPKEGAALSSFKALMISTASRVGVGNIAGVATAVALGGPGAIFWMWAIALIGGATAFVESTLAQIYKKRTKDGHSIGGPAYYITQGLKLPWLGFAFALALILTYIGGFNLVASYTVNETLTSYTSFYNPNVTPYIVGVVLAIAFGLAIFGGIKRLSRVTSVLVPIMALGYVALSVVIIVANAGNLPAVFSSIFSAAFDFQAIFGGFAGSALLYGIKRGLYSNEAGVGSAPNAAATAGVSHPVKQGLVQMLSVWIDTMLICTATALAVLASGVPGSEDLKATPLVQAAWKETFGAVGPNIVTLALLLFAFTTLIGNYTYAELNLAVLLRREPKRVEMVIFRLLCCLIVFYGAIAEFELAWNLADILMGVMVLINVPSILLLSRRAMKALEDYSVQKEQGKDPHFVARAAGIDEPLDYWQ